MHCSPARLFHLLVARLSRTPRPWQELLPLPRIEITTLPPSSWPGHPPGSLELCLQVLASQRPCLSTQTVLSFVPLNTSYILTDTYVCVTSVSLPGLLVHYGFPSTCQYRRRRRHGFGKIPWRRKRQPTLVFLPGKSHGQRSLVG